MSIDPKAAAHIARLEAEVERQGEQIERMEYSDGDAEHWRHLATRLEADVARLTKERITAERDALEYMGKLQRAASALEPFDALFRDFVGPVKEEWFDRFAEATGKARATLSSIKEPTT